MWESELSSNKGLSNKTYDFHNPYTVRISRTPPTHPQSLTGTKINSYTWKTKAMYLLKLCMFVHERVFVFNVLMRLSHVDNV